MIDIVLLVVGTIGLLVGTITDFQKREVADWVNFGLIFAGLGIRAIGALVRGDVWYLLWGLIWFGIAYLFGLVMYYTGQWGGGDCKMIMGLGALYGTTAIGNSSFDFVQSLLGLNFAYNVSFFPHFLFNSFLVGAFYGLIWTFALVLLHRKAFLLEFSKKIKEKQMKLLIGLGVFAFIGGYVFMYAMSASGIILHSILWMILILPFLMVFIRAVEKGCMVSMMKIKDLTEGEWVVDDVIIDKKYITGPKELGITLDQIDVLRKLHSKGKIDAVKVKIGIPFVPAFAIAFVLTIFFGNLMLIFF